MLQLSSDPPPTPRECFIMHQGILDYHGDDKKAYYWLAPSALEVRQ